MRLSLYYNKKNCVRILVIFFLIYLAPFQIFASEGGFFDGKFGKDGKDGKGDPADITDLDFKIQNQSLISVNESSYSITTMTSNRGNIFYPASNAKDGNLGTAWSDYLTHGSSSYLKIDFGEKIVVSKVHIVNGVDGNSGVASFDLEYSKSSGWSKIGTYKTDVEDDEIIEIDVPEISTQMLRITNFSLGSGKNCAAFKEFQVNMPTMLASSSSSPPSNANDGKKNTFWSNCSGYDSDDFLQVDLGKVVVVTSVHIINYVNGEKGMSAFSLEYYDESDWKEIGQYTTNLDSEEIIEIKVPGIYTKHLRITDFSFGHGKSCAGISEFQVNTPIMTSNESDDSSHVPFFASDEDEKSYWTNCDDFDEDDYLKIDLGNKFNVSRVEISNYYPEVGEAGMQVFDIEYFDGGKWVTIDTYRGANRHQSFFNLRFNKSIEAQRFRITNFEAAVNRSCVGLSEVAFFTPDRNYYGLYYEGGEYLPNITKVELSEDESSSDNSEPRDIIVTGVNFIESPSGNTIHFENDDNSFEVENSSGSSSKIYATVPEDADPGTYDVYVTNENGTSNILSDAYEVIDKDASKNPAGLGMNVDSSNFGVCFISTSLDLNINVSHVFLLLLTLIASTITILYEKKYHSFNK